MSDDDDRDLHGAGTRPLRGVSEGAVAAALARYSEALASGGEPAWAMRLALETAKQIDVSEDVLGIPPIALDDEPTAMERLIAADAEHWHHECRRRGALFEQSVGATVLAALVRARVGALRVLIHEMQVRLHAIEDRVISIQNRVGG